MCTLFDAHAHFHDAFCVSVFLNHAARNFGKAAGNIVTDDGEAPSCVLALCEMDSKRPPLHRIKVAVDDATTGDWRVLRENDASLVVGRDHRGDTSIDQLIIVASRQLVSSERLEVLSLCSCSVVQNNQPLASMVQQIVESQAVPVIPWGFGKWLFARGRALESSLSGYADASSLPFLGDNGCRWRGWRPNQFDRAQRLGIHVLAGSDPLPLREHEVRAATFGSVLPSRIESDDPAKQLREVILKGTTSDQTFGGCRSLPAFVWDQFTLRRRKP